MDEGISKFYFIDTENVANRWLPLLDEPNSRFYVFYTDYSPSMSYANLARLLKISDRIEFLHCATGHNGLDFQLATYLGHKMRDIATSEVIIASNDTSFDAVISFWTERGMNIRRQSIPVHSKKKPASTSNSDSADDSIPALDMASTSTEIIVYTDNAILPNMDAESLEHLQ